jgi:Flp pilus assembly protein TadG
MSDDGFATAETAVLLPVLVLLLVLGATVVRAYRTELALQDAAKVAARSIARGDDEGEAVRLAQAAGPPGLALTLGRGSGLVTAEATEQLSAPAALRRLLPTLTMRASATALDEP